MDPRVPAITDRLGGTTGLRWFRAPGRVNLIGDHTDYHDGFVLPLAIDRDCVVAARARDDGRVTVRSVELADEVDVAADGSDEPAAVEPAWGRYVAGVVRALAGAGRAPVGFDAAAVVDRAPGLGPVVQRGAGSSDRARPRRTPPGSRSRRRSSRGRASAASTSAPVCRAA